MGAPYSVMFRIGEAVPWPHAPERLAQIEDLHRTRVTIVYTTRTGRIRRPRVGAAELAAIVEHDRKNQPVLPMTNPLARGAARFPCRR